MSAPGTPVAPPTFTKMPPLPSPVFRNITQDCDRHFKQNTGCWLHAPRIRGNMRQLSSTLGYQSNSTFRTAPNSTMGPKIDYYKGSGEGAAVGLNKLNTSVGRQV